MKTNNLMRPKSIALLIILTITINFLPGCSLNLSSDKDTTKITTDMETVKSGIKKRIMNI